MFTILLFLLIFKLILCNITSSQQSTFLNWVAGQPVRPLLAASPSRKALADLVRAFYDPTVAVAAPAAAVANATAVAAAAVE